MFSQTEDILRVDRIKEKYEQINQEDCCSPMVCLVPEVDCRIDDDGIKDPNASVIAPTMNYGNQFDYPSTKKWRTIGLFAGSKERKECLLTILAGQWEENRELKKKWYFASFN